MHRKYWCKSYHSCCSNNTKEDLCYNLTDNNVHRALVNSNLTYQEVRTLNIHVWQLFFITSSDIHIKLHKFSKQVLGSVG